MKAVNKAKPAVHLRPLEVRRILAILSGLLLPAFAIADTTISTYSSWDRNQPTFIQPWGGAGATPTYGQTFTTPADHFLQNVTFSIRNTLTVPIPFQPFVFAWTGTTITGSALFAGATSSVPALNTFNEVDDISVSTGNLLLQTGQQYVVFLTTTTTDPPASAAASWGAITSGANVYPNGQFVFNNASSFASLVNGWRLDFPGQPDLAFSLFFASVPEPSVTAALIGSALCAAAAIQRRRRCRQSLRARSKR